MQPLAGMSKAPETARADGQIQIALVWIV